MRAPSYSTNARPARSSRSRIGVGAAATESTLSRSRRAPTSLRSSIISSNRGRGWTCALRTGTTFCTSWSCRQASPGLRRRATSQACRTRRHASGAARRTTTSSGSWRGSKPWGGAWCPSTRAWCTRGTTTTTHPSPSAPRTGRWQCSTTSSQNSCMSSGHSARSRARSCTSSAWISRSNRRWPSLPEARRTGACSKSLSLARGTTS
mmetsp:Transcript_47826/g.113859  ORF Transcript_47826/g.113859 Transcript_47826/m.113859 type:complete len:207 (+) Transcript_47826:809-1429(+)